MPKATKKLSPARCDRDAAIATRSRRIAGLAALLTFTLPLGGCATLDQVSRLYLNATPEGRDLLKRYDHYAKIADQLKRYHDDGGLDGAEVVEVLIDAGVIEPVPGHPPGGDRRPDPSEPQDPPKPASDSRWGWPMEAGVISSEFGQRSSKPHEGIDIAADIGEPIFAASSGTVIYSGNGMRGYGNSLILRHADSTTTLYAHAAALDAKQGANVSRGTRIATVGSTGRSTGPHLHFEVRVGETPVDPRSVLPRQPF
jgi:murein DD-endopeptidase MepM/ murein hydrolase activator NlpD